MSSARVPVLGFLFVSFRPSLIRSHSCSSGASLLLSLSGFPLSSADDLRFRSVLTTQPSDLSFPFFPFSPVGGSFGALRFLASPSPSSSVRPVSMPLFRFRYSAFCVSFLLRRLASQGYLSVSTSSFRFRPLPLAFALGSDTRLKRPLFKDTRQSLTYVSRQLGYNSTPSIICQHLFSNFFNKFYFLLFCTFHKISPPRSKPLLEENSSKKRTDEVFFIICVTSFTSSDLAIVRPPYL